MSDTVVRSLQGLLAVAISLAIYSLPAPAQAGSGCTGHDLVGTYNPFDGSVPGQQEGRGAFSLAFEISLTNMISFSSRVKLIPFPALPIAGDWDGDCQTTVGGYVPQTAGFHLRASNELSSEGDADEGSFVYRFPGHVPLAGDWTGRGFDTVGAYDPVAGRFFLRNNNPHRMLGASAPSHTIAAFRFQQPNRLPLAGDWDGDGIDTIGVYDPATGTFYLRNDNSAGPPDLIFRFQDPGMLPVAGDWDGDGIDTVGVYLPSIPAAWVPLSKFYVRNSNSTGRSNQIIFVSFQSDRLPIAGNWWGTRAP